jgi:7,8-dihydropterin-6-yl-methyl-4-(beta-D-ribofuranosyl)aminobenzene 5'-phosphate synthase
LLLHTLCENGSRPINMIRLAFVEPNMKLCLPIVFLLVLLTSVRAQTPHVESLKVTVLSTMLAGDPAFKGIGEWGFSALIEADNHKLLIDTGERPETVLQNARELGIDLSDVTDVIITHNHWDHVGGLLTLRREFSRKNPKAFSRAHVAQGIFLNRSSTTGGRETNGLLPLKAQYEETGGVFIVHNTHKEILPGVWFTGPIPRVHPERNFDPRGRIVTSQGDVQDDVPEDASIVVNTAQGLIVISGCGHAGIINTADYARKIVAPARIHALIGGLHLFMADDTTLAWTAAKLREFGLDNLLAAHCTGIEATYRLRTLVGLDRRRAVVSAVGSSFTLSKGIDPLLLAR